MNQVGVYFSPWKDMSKRVKQRVGPDVFVTKDVPFVLG